MRQTHRTTSGLTLIEVLIASAVFAVVAIGLYQSYAALFRVIDSSRVNLVASSLATEQFEIIRNLPYSDVGVSGSIPAGVIPHEQTLTRDGIAFVVTTTVRNVDDPFDGTIGGTPNDTAPADYRLVEVRIECVDCRNFSPTVFTTRVSPKNLEMSSTNGALFVRVFDANGVGVQGADVHIENNQVSPAIVIDDVTGADGTLQLVDIPPGTGAYEITVSKTGYSSDQTYPAGGAGNPNPTKPHSTVLAQQVTQISLSIDKVSSLSVESVTQTCASVGSVDFQMTGAKLIGTGPDLPKYDVAHATDASGDVTIEDLEWDTYALVLTDAAYQLSGLIPLLPPTIAPDSHLDVQLVVAPKDPNVLLVTVKDSATLLPISEADVVLDGSVTQTTGRGFIRQTDWSGGSGQALWVDETMYDESDGNVTVDAPAGVIQLDESFGQYAPSGELTSSVFDVGTPSNFYHISWQPEDQPPTTGLDAVRFQVATSDDAATTTWEFLGPDGTSGTYYTVSDQNINAVHNGKQYFRYKTLLQTADASTTPTISDVSFTFTSDCVPPGQVTFSGLSDGTYTVEVSKSGYQTHTSVPISVTTEAVSYEVTLSP